MTVEIFEYLDGNDHSPFGIWFDRLPAAAAAKIVVALDRIGRGLLGDVNKIVILLGGGTKKRQYKDIGIAQDRWKDFKARRRKGERVWH